MEKNWVPISIFMEKTGVTKVEIYNRIRDRDWWDGYVLKRSPAKKAKSEKFRREGKIIRWGCVEDFNKWAGLE